MTDDTHTMGDCYRVEELWFETPMFTPQLVPLTVVITMEKSSRRASYMDQLSIVRPTRRVVILHNTPYRQCRKPAHVASPASDLWHANVHIATKICKDEPFVLVLEDDVVFDVTKVRDQVADIERLLVHRAGSSGASRRLAYSMGSLSLLGRVTRSKHVRMHVGGFAHAVVYSRGALEQFPRVMMPKWAVHDLFLFPQLETYCSRQGCAVQPYEHTANAKRWDALGVFDRVYTLNKRDPWRLYRRYDHCNACGGVVGSGLVVATVVAALCSKVVKP